MVATSILDALSSAQIDKKTAWSRIRTCQFLRNSLKESGPIKSLQQGLISFLSESKTIRFVKPSDKAAKPNKKEPIVGILHEANDWKIDSDIPEFQRDLDEFVFPFWICSTDLKPDCVIFSMQRKTCIVLEMTVPMDINIEKWHSVKLEKYQAGIQLEANKDWSIYVYPIEVGARGFINNRVHGNFLQIGIDRKSATSTIRKMSHMARRCSYVIWLYRFNQNFKPYRLDGTSVSDEAKKSNLIQHFSLYENDCKQEFKS
jgi:hypothetical protein